MLGFLAVPELVVSPKCCTHFPVPSNDKRKTLSSSSIGPTSKQDEVSLRIQRIIKQRKGRIGIRELARKVGRNPSSILRHLRRRGIKLADSTDCVTPDRDKRRLQALALVFLGLSRDQVERLIGVKSETTRKYLLGLAPVQGALRVFDDEKVREWDGLLEKNFGMPDSIFELRDGIGSHAQLNERDFLTSIRSLSKPDPDFACDRLYKILKREVQLNGELFKTTDYKGQVFEFKPKGFFK